MTVPYKNRRQVADLGNHVRALHPVSTFEPRSTVRCVGRPVFRSQSARDAGCLLDIDPEVVSWTTGGSLDLGPVQIAYDLKATYANRTELIVLADNDKPFPGEAVEAANQAGYRLKSLDPSDLAGDRLETARELIRYANWRVSLSDRVRLLAALEAEGSLTLAECLPTIRSGRDPIAAIASLFLQRFLEIDLDNGRIGPQTRIAAHRG